MTLNEFLAIYWGYVVFFIGAVVTAYTAYRVAQENKKNKNSQLTMNERVARLARDGWYSEVTKIMELETTRIKSHNRIKCSYCGREYQTKPNSCPGCGASEWIL